jgi:hypothetical protein
VATLNKKTQTVTLSAALYEFYMAEALKVHALCDKVQVPTELEGSELSMSQRVAVLSGVIEEQMRKVGKGQVMQ